LLADVIPDELAADGRTVTAAPDLGGPVDLLLLAPRLIAERAALDPQWLRYCARTECGLLSYDTTRCRTLRRHAEDPCGWRERHRHRRASHS